MMFDLCRGRREDVGVCSTRQVWRAAWNRIEIQGLDDAALQGFDWSESHYQGLAIWPCRNIIFHACRITLLLSILTP